MMVYRTMIGEWPNSQQLQDALQALLSGSSSSSESDLQTAELTDQEPQWRYSKSLNQGDAVTANVGPVPFSTSPILVDPILSVLGPDGTIVAFNDDFIGFYPQVDFTADSTGSYTFEVSSYFRGSTGNFLIRY